MRTLLASTALLAFLFQFAAVHPAAAQEPLPGGDPRKPLLNLTGHSADVYTVAAEKEAKLIDPGQPHINYWRISRQHLVSRGFLEGFDVHPIQCERDSSLPLILEFGHE